MSREGVHGRGLAVLRRPRRGLAPQAEPRVPAREGQVRRAPRGAQARGGRPEHGRASQPDNMEPEHPLPKHKGVQVAGRAGGKRPARRSVPVVHARQGLRGVQKVSGREGRVREDGVVPPEGGPGEDEMKTRKL